MKRKYKGYAQSVGFDPIQAPDTTRRMAEADSRMIRGMEAQRSANLQNREAVSQGLSRKNQLEADNRDQNYKFSKQNRQMVQDAELRNRQVLIENANRQAAAQVNQLKPLAEFSESLSKTITGYQEAASEQAYIEGVNKGMFEGFPPETLAQRDQIEGTLTAQDEQIQRVADGLAARGSGPEIVFGVRSIGRSHELGLMKGRIMNAGANYPDWLEDKFLNDNETKVEVGDKVLTPATAITSEDKAAVREALRVQYLRQTGLFGIKPVMLNEALVQMREAEQRMAARDRQVFAKTESDRMFQAAESNFETQISTDPGTAVNEWLRTVGRTLGPDGRSPLGPRAALDMLKGKLIKAPPGTVTEAVIEAIEGTAPFNQPTTTYGKQFPWFFEELRREIQDDQIRESDRQEKMQTIEQKEKLNQLRELVSSTDFPREQIQKLVDEWREEYGTVPAELADYIDAYGVLPGLTVTAEELDRQFKAAAQDRTLTLAEVQDPRVPYEIRKKYEKDAIDIQETIKGSDNYKAAASVFDAALETKLAGFRNDFGSLPPSSTLEFAKARAIAEYQRIFKTLSAGATTPEALAKAQTDAIQQVMTDIDGNKPTSVFFFPTSQDFTDPKKAASLGITADDPEFPNILKQLTGAPISSTARLGSADKLVDGIKRIIGDGRSERVIDTHLLIPKEILDGAVAQMEAGNYTVPPIVQMIADEFKGRISPYEIIDRQLQARGSDKRVTRAPAVVAAEQLDPRLQQILNYNNTYLRSRRATLSSSDYTPFLNLIASKESNGYGGYDAMNIPITYAPYNSRNRLGRPLSEMTVAEVMQQHADGKVYAAGRYQIIQGTLAGLMNGAYGAIPVKPTDRFDQKAQDQMAIALANHRLKQGGANPVDLRKAFRSEWEGFKNINDATLDNAIQNLRAAATSPYRSPDFMSARLVYHIGNKGYGSNGAHKHVGSVDGSYFSRNELDKYIEIEMKGKRVSLSQAMTAAGGEFGASRDNGKRKHTGWDYAAPDGTPVFLKGGAKVVSNSVDNSPQGGGSSNMIIQTPDGRKFIFHHGTAAKGATNT